MAEMAEKLAKEVVTRGFILRLQHSRCGETKDFLVILDEHLEFC